MRVSRSRSLHGVVRAVSVAVAVAAPMLLACDSENSAPSGELSAKSGAAVTIDTTAWYQLVNDKSGLCLDDQGGLTTNSAPVDQASCATSNNNQWKFVSVATGVYQLQNRTSTYCLNQQGSTVSGGLLNQWSNCASTSNNLRWTVTDLGNGYVNVISKTSSMCVDDPGGSTSAGTVQDQATCASGNTNMMWQLVNTSSDGGVEGGSSSSSSSSGGSSSSSGSSSGSSSSSSSGSSSGGSSGGGIDTTAWYELTNDASQLCLDDQNGSTTSGTAVDQAACGVNNNTQWHFNPVSGGHYILTNRTSGDCLSNGNHSSSGMPISQVSGCISTQTQNTWTATNLGNGYMNLTVTKTGMCLTDPSGATAPGTVQQEQTCVSGNTSMEWQLVKYASPPPSPVWTNRYDVGRSGSQTAEAQLTQAAVSGGKFGRLFTLPVDGTIQAQPLYAPNMTIGGATHNVVFVATEHNSVYAFDADTLGSPLWQVNLGPSAPTAGAPWTCLDMTPESGISATPVLDVTSGTLYVLAETLEGGAYHRKLHALNWATGLEQTTINGTSVTSPVEIAPPQADWTTPPANHFSRVGLLLDHGTIYSAYSSHCDQPGPWYGWVVANSASNLQMQGAFETGKYGGIWQSGQGLTTDGNGSIFFVAGTGSGAVGSGCNANNLCQTVGRLQLGGGALTLNGYYQPAPGSPAMATSDLDLTTAFVFAAGNTAVASGKDGTLHLVDHTTMTSVQDLLVSTNPPTGSGTGGGHIHGGPVYWNGSMGPRVYVWPEGTDPMKAFAVTPTSITTTPVATYSKRLPSHPGAIITISANGPVPGTGVLWAAMVTTDSADAWHGLVPGTLYALNAENPSDSNTNAMLWNSDAATGGADQLGLFSKFCPPTVANGKLYIGTAIGTDNSSSTAELRVYGLKP